MLQPQLIELPVTRVSRKEVGSVACSRELVPTCDRQAFSTFPKDPYKPMAAATQDGSPMPACKVAVTSANTEKLAAIESAFHGYFTFKYHFS